MHFSLPNRFGKYIVTSFLILCCILGYSQEEHFFDSVEGDIQPGMSFTVQDDKFQSIILNPNIEETYSVRNRVGVEIIKNSIPQNLESTSFSFNIRVLTFDTPPPLLGEHQPTGEILETLTINFDENYLNTSDSKVFFEFDGSRKMTVFIDQIEMDLALKSTPKFLVSGDIMIDRLYKFNLNSTVVLPNPVYDPNSKRINFTWSTLDEGSEEYDLEWTFYDAKSDQANNSAAYSFNELFKNNSTRVTVSNTFYSIPALYPEGIVFCRVRKVRYKDGIREHSEWSYTSDDSIPNGFLVSTEWHEKDLNWQSQISFAEEGKHVPSINYFDGSLRQRQSVTFSNAISYPIVQQNIYDYLGRPTISVMAAPNYDKDAIEFDPLFASIKDLESNLEIVTYTKQNITDTNGCLNAPPPMDNSNGAAKYFSSNNAMKFGKNKFIPEAEGYVFSTSEYMPDLTGRMRRQSGVGNTFKLGTDHETKYYYGKASKEELVRIFDTQVGLDAHYQKNMVQDPNGQLSISYMDAHGRTIATSLAGDVPENTQVLNSNKEPIPIQTDLLNNIQNDYTQISTYSLLVSNPSPYTFSYHVDAKVPEFDCLPIDVCYDCIYDVKISIDDNCGNLYNNGEKLIINVNNVSPNELSTLCSDQDLGIDLSEVVPIELTDDQSTQLVTDLPVGEYKITKELRVSRSAAEAYLEDFLTHESCVPNYDTIFENILVNMDTTGCLDRATEEFQPTECELIKEILLVDVRPGGKESPYERDAFGKVITTEGLINGGKFRMYFSNEDIYNSGEEIIKIKDMTEDQFVDLYQDEWSEKLIEGHSMSACYEDCLESIDIVNYVNEIQYTNTFAEAVTNGFIDPQTCQPDMISNDGSLCEYFLYNLFSKEANLYPAIVNGYTIDGVLNSVNVSIASIQEYAEFMTSVTDYEWKADQEILNIYFYSKTDLDHNSFSVDLTYSGELGSRSKLGETTRFLPCNPLEENYEPLCLKRGYSVQLDFAKERYPYQIEELRLNGELISFEPSSKVINSKVEMASFLSSLTGVEWFYDSLNRFKVATELILDIGDIRHFPLISPSSITISVTNVNISLYPCEDLSFQDAMEPYLGNIDPNSCVSQDVIDLIAVLVYCNGEYPCFTDFGKGCQTDNDLAWNMYKNIFLTRQGQLYSQQYCNYQKFMTDYISINFEDFEEPELFGNDKFDMYPPEPEDVTQEYLEEQRDINIAAMLLECQTNCEAQANGWLSQISPCFTNTADQSEIDRVRNALITVCKNGCSPLRPIGASSVNPTMLNEFANFEEVLASVDGITECDPECNPKMINFPAPAGVDPYFGNRTIGLISQGLDDTGENCICERVVELESCYEGYIADNNGEDEYGSFSDYLGQFSDTGISQSNLDTLITYCNNDCNALPVQIVLPPYLDCDICKTPEEVEVALEDFDGLSCDTENFEELRAIHLNYKFGYNILSEDYTAFLEDVTNFPNRCHMICPTSLFGDIPINETACEDQLKEHAEIVTDIIYDNKIDEVSEAFLYKYMNDCVKLNNESFVAEGIFGEHHFTLYYYDQAGNLVQTIAPEGTIDENDNHKVPSDYTFKTNYVYNTFNQVVEQVSPDTYIDNNGDGKASLNEYKTTKFWYDNVGRVVASQDGRQFPDSLYSYTLYDALGRIIEVGELPIFDVVNIPNDQSSRNGSFTEWVAAASGKMFVTKTYYDKEKFPLFQLMEDDFTQDNLRNRVVSVTYERVDDSDDTTYDSGTHYNYDVTGNVASLVQEISALHAVNHGYKKIDYEYDYISGNVNAVYYQKGKEDQYTHRYVYDENNRLTSVKTSAVETGESAHEHSNPSQDWALWDNEAIYEYYDHGPLARTVIGEEGLQGCDYAYNLQGWIKGVNSSLAMSQRDMGKDGTTSFGTSKDVYGYTIGYFDNDYQPIDPSQNFEATYTGSYFDSQAPSLYNGNIRNMVVDIEALRQPIGYTYNYDQLHRIKSMESHKNINSTSNSWEAVGDTDDSFQSSYSYDANGNIDTLKRNGSNGAEDFLTYDYDENANRLNKVIDRVSPNFANSPGYVSNHSSFRYDGAGNLVKEKLGSQPFTTLSTITWSPYGKVDKVITPDAETNFGYGPDQNRISKNIIKIDEPTENSCFESRYEFGSSRLHSDFPITIKGFYLEGNNSLNLLFPDENGELDFVVNSVQELSEVLNIRTQYNWAINQFSKVYFVPNTEAEFEEINDLNILIFYMSPQFPTTSSFAFGNKLDVSVPCEPISLETTTYYIRDAQGNVMSVYNVQDEEITWKEQHLYGSSRLGSVEPNVVLSQSNANPYYKEQGKLYEGQKRYELSNHLGNVLAVINDRKKLTARGQLSTYDATVISAQDYFPFGLEMGSDREVNNSESGYRYGFNGKEKDTDGEFGSTTTYDYGFRIYNPAIAKFLSVDPLMSDYPSWTPYAFAMNRPIDGLDLDGLEYISANILNEVFSTDPEFVLSTYFDTEAVNYQNQTYYNVNKHLYLDQDGNVTDKAIGALVLANPRNKKITSWVYNSEGPVVNTTDNVGYRDAGSNCFKAACSTVDNAGYDPNSYWDISTKQMYKEEGKNGGLAVTAQSIEDAYDLIHTSLENGRPVLVGIDDGEGHPGNHDQTTDHFVVIVDRGFDDDGREFFRYFDNTGQKTTELNKLYIKADGMLESENGIFRGQNGNYKVTHVRSVE